MKPAPLSREAANRAQSTRAMPSMTTTSKYRGG
jgi:hypothetical protein